MKNLKNQIEKLTVSQKKKLIEELKRELEKNTIVEKEHIYCPTCTSDSIVKFGKYNGRTRFRCKECSKTFTGLTGTSISWIKKGKQWNEFLYLTLENKTIREISEELCLSTKTVFEWRHRLFSSLQNIFTKKFKGIIEIDDVHGKLNQKGRKKNLLKFETQRGDNDNSVKFLVMIDRYKTMDMKLVRKGRLESDDLKRVVNKTRIDDDNVFVSDKHPSIKKYYREENLTNVTLKSGTVIGTYHVNGLNGFVSEFNRWIKGNYNSVSTKHFQNYLNMFMMWKMLKGDKDKVNTLYQFSMVDDLTFLRRKTSETRYQRFLTR